MKTIKLFAILLALLGGVAITAHSATNGVVLGQNFQSVIDASSPGDVLIVQPGVYPDASLVFNKPLTVLPSGTNGNPIQFTGTIQITGAGTSSFQQAYFVSSVQTTGSTVSFFDSTFNGNVNVTGGKVTMKRTILNYPLTLTNNAALEALRMTNNATVTATAAAGSGTTFLAVQSWFTNAVCLSGYKAWFGYNNFTNTGQLLQTNCDSVLLGNKFLVYENIPQGSTNAAVYAQGGTLKAYNNFITSSEFSQSTIGYGIWLNSSSAEIVNNTIITGTVIPFSSYNYTLRGIYAGGGGGPVTVRGDVFDELNTCGCSYFNGAAVEAAGAVGQTLFVSYCDSWLTGSGSSLLGVVPSPVSLIEVNPNLAADGSPNPGSPCINAGPPDAIYNNRDGTRNTMGYTGGPYWNPANYTNNNPMIFLLTGQQTAIKSVQTSIPVNVGAAAGQ